MAKEIQNKIISSARISIPQSGGQPQQRKVPWWNPNVAQGVKNRRKALRKFQIQPTMENLATYRLENAKARRIIKNEKKKSWNEYTSSIKRETPIGDVFRKVRAIQGTNTPIHIPTLKTNDGAIISDPQVVVELFADQFQKVSSIGNYSREFLELKNNQEKNIIAINESDHPINNIINMEELESALNECKGSSPGPDDIHYTMLKNLNGKQKEYLLKTYNSIWKDWTFPEDWKIANIVPIPKPGKDLNYAENYRPISLTSCICKLMEKIINKRLQWYLEINNIISNSQSGFRKEGQPLIISLS